MYLDCFCAVGLALPRYFAKAAKISELHNHFSLSRDNQVLRRKQNLSLVVFTQIKRDAGVMPHSPICHPRGRLRQRAGETMSANLIEEEAIIIAFRRHTLLPLDDCLYALQLTIRHLTRSSLHRCLKRHGISRLPDVEGDKTAKKTFKRYPIGYFHIDTAEVRTAEGKLLLIVASYRTSNCAFVELHEKAPTRVPPK